MNSQHRNVRFLCTLLFVGMFTVGLAQANYQKEQSTEDSEKRVLFVGNSFINFYNVPHIVEAMVETNGSSMFIKKSTVGGANLEQHWKGEKGTITMELLESQQWDYVVFNNHSKSAIATPESFMTYGKKFAEKIQKTGAQPVFMITWAYESNPLMQEEITQAYQQLAKETGAAVIPAGPLFAQARALRPDLILFHDDKHQSITGTYLIGLAFYQYFEEKPSLGIPGTLSTEDKNGEVVFLSHLKSQEAHFLQQLVDDFKLLPLD